MPPRFAFRSAELKTFQVKRFAYKAQQTHQFFENSPKFAVPLEERAPRVRCFQPGTTSDLFPSL
jgi:hypothetical protein